jgi:hypothetical protein
MGFCRIGKGGEISLWIFIDAVPSASLGSVLLASL